jgi:tetratricopeptide (TPR) repeat protein
VKRLVLALVVLAACSSPEAKPETPAERRARCEKRLVDAGDKDPWAFYELAQLDEQEGELARAIDEYGSAVSLLPPKRYTGPALGLGRVHMKLSRWEPARRMFDEVLQTVPEDPALYRKNGDYREAALGLKEVYAHVKDERAAARTRQRFLDEFGGKPSEWPE